MAMTESCREVGVVVRRRSIDNPWIDHIWSPAMMLDEVPATAPWTVLSSGGRRRGLLRRRRQHRPVQFGHRQLPRQPRRRRTAGLGRAAAPRRRAGARTDQGHRRPHRGRGDVRKRLRRDRHRSDAARDRVVDRRLCRSIPRRARVPQAQAGSRGRRPPADTCRAIGRTRAQSAHERSRTIAAIRPGGFLARWSQRKHEAKQTEIGAGGA